MNQRTLDHIDGIREQKQSDEYKKLKAEIAYKTDLRDFNISLLSLSIGLIGFSIQFLFIDWKANFENYSMFALAGTFTLVGLGKLLSRYLGKGTDFTNLFRDPIYYGIGKEINDLKIEISVLKNSKNKKEDFDRINSTINKAIESTVTEDYLRSKIELSFSENAIAENKRKDILNDFYQLNIRINSELVRLRNSANLNLVIGALVTICALISLGIVVFKQEIVFLNTTEILAHYIPRISLIVFVEIFAFFFLKLYKAALDDIKYFNNEKTNIDFKIISLKSAMATNDTKLIQIMLEELIRTERNFKLAKNESTVELEKLRNNTSNLSILADIIEKLKLK